LFFSKKERTDLYIRINEHKRYLNLKYGKEVVTKFAAQDIIKRYNRNLIDTPKFRLINFGYKRKKVKENKKD